MVELKRLPLILSTGLNKRLTKRVKSIYYFLKIIISY